MKKSLIILVLLLAAAAMAQTGADPQAQGGQAAPTGPTIKDPAEYNAYVTALNQSDLAAKAQALDTFLQQYPNSVVKVSGLELLMATYQQLGNAQKLMDAATRLLQADPNNLRALALLTYLYRQQAEAGGPNAAQALQQAAQYAQKGLLALQTAQKPTEVSPADWGKLKTQTQAIFAGAAGMAAMQQKNYKAASASLQEAVNADPMNLNNIYALAVAYLEQQPPDPRGLWYIARSTDLAAGAPAAASIGKYGRAKYIKYHGTDDGWDQLLAQAKTATEPPPGFTVKPAPTPAEQAANLASTKPVDQMSFDEFQLILTSGNQPAADKVWGAIKGKPIRFEGKVISTTKNSVMLAATVDDGQNNKADVELTFEAPIAAALVPKQGAMSKVQGTPATYDVNPFMIHMTSGAFIGAPPKPPAHKPPVRKKPSQ